MGSNGICSSALLKYYELDRNGNLRLKSPFQGIDLPEMSCLVDKEFRFSSGEVRYSIRFCRNKSSDGSIHVLTELFCSSNPSIGLRSKGYLDVTTGKVSLSDSHVSNYSEVTLCDDPDELEIFDSFITDLICCLICLHKENKHLYSKLEGFLKFAEELHIRAEMIRPSLVLLPQ